MDYDFQRPELIPGDRINLELYTGNYSWDRVPERFYVTFYLDNGILFLDDYSINELYPIGQDLFYSTKNPWRVRFIRDDKNEVRCVELIFLQQSVTLKKMN